MLTIACVYVAGEYRYTPEFVTRLFAMCRRWIVQPFRCLCLTDRPDEIAGHGIETVRITRSPGCFAFWTKMRLFDPALQLRGRVLALDLDSLIVGALEPVVNYPGQLVLATDCLTHVRVGYPEIGSVDRHGRALIKKFQGSVMVWDGGTCADLWTDWTPAVAARLSTDQDWIGERYPFAAAMPLSWTPRISQIGLGPVPADARIVFCKKPKNDVAAQLYSWVDQVWRAA